MVSRKREWLAVLLLAPALCPAQLATSGDGRQVLLTTNWRLAGESFEPLHQGVYFYSGEEWKQFAHASNGVGLGRPFLSTDGTVAAWDRTSPCFGSCMIALPRSFVEVQGLASGFPSAVYAGVLSRNARYLLAPGFLGLSNFALTDLAAGQTWGPSGVPVMRAFGVADDGTVIGLAAAYTGGFLNVELPHRVMLWRPGAEPREIFRTSSVWNAWIAADASAALVETAGPDPSQARELWWVDAGGGSAVRIAQRPPDTSYHALEPANHQIGNDGRRVLFLWPGPSTSLWFWQTGGTVREAAHAAEGFVTAALSGDGRVAWALTRAGRLLRIDLDGGAIEEVLGALPPRLDPGYWGSTPGSDMLWRSDGGISPGLRFLSGDLEFPVVDESASDSIAVQIPWEAPTGNLPPLVVRRPGNPFELAYPMTVESGLRPVLAGDVVDGKLWIKAPLADYSALVSADHPAPAGSTIHTYFFNLGPLDRPVATGAPGPSDPPAVPLAHLGCFLLTSPSSPGRALDMPFLAYAPQLIGVYQADLTIPADWPPGPALLICDIAGSKASGWLYVGQGQ